MVFNTSERNIKHSICWEADIIFLNFNNTSDIFAINAASRFLQRASKRHDGKICKDSSSWKLEN